MRSNKLKGIFSFLLGLAVVATSLNATSVSAEQQVTLVKREEVTVEQLGSDGGAARSIWIENTATIDTYSDGSTKMNIDVSGAQSGQEMAYLQVLKISENGIDYTDATATDVDENDFPTGFSFPIVRGSNGVEQKDLKVTYTLFPMPGYFPFPDGHEVNQKLSIDWSTLDEVALPAPDTSVLEALITTAKAYSADAYTADSFSALTSAITSAERLLATSGIGQADVNAEVRTLQTAIDGLVSNNNQTLADGIYELPVALWNASEDKPSMAASAIIPTARISIVNGNAKMYIYTQEMSFGSITASLQTLKVNSLTRAYEPATVETRDANGNPTSFSFVLPHREEYISVKVNPMVAMMGNQDIDARLKLDYVSIKQVDANTDLLQAPSGSVSTNQTASVPTGDSTNTGVYGTMLLMALAVGLITYKKLHNAK